MEVYNGMDIYCDRIIPRLIDIVKETKHVLAFHHTRPHWKTHIIVVPKTHILSFIELVSGKDDVKSELLGVVADVAKMVKEEKESGCTVFTTIGDNQQSKHLHVHIHNGEETV